MCFGIVWGVSMVRYKEEEARVFTFYVYFNDRFLICHSSPPNAVSVTLTTLYFRGRKVGRSENGQYS